MEAETLEKIETLTKESIERCKENNWNDFISLYNGDMFNEKTLRETFAECSDILKNTNPISYISEIKEITKKKIGVVVVVETKPSISLIYQCVRNKKDLIVTPLVLIPAFDPYAEQKIGDCGTPR